MLNVQILPPINSVDCEFYFCIDSFFFPLGTLMVFSDWWIILHRIHSTPKVQIMLLLKYCKIHLNFINALIPLDIY